MDIRSVAFVFARWGIAIPYGPRRCGREAFPVRKSDRGYLGRSNGPDATMLGP